MSLEDKAKEYAVNKWISSDPRTEVDRDHSAEDYEAGYKQGIDDLINLAKENELPFLNLYKHLAERLKK